MNYDLANGHTVTIGWEQVRRLVVDVLKQDIETIKNYSDSYDAYTHDALLEVLAYYTTPDEFDSYINRGKTPKRIDFKMMSKEEMLEVLRNDVATVQFEKSDGTMRTMLCTLLEDHLPVPEEAEVVKGNGRKPNDHVITVWDIEKDDWRSFRIDSIKSFVVG